MYEPSRKHFKMLLFMFTLFQADATLEMEQRDFARAALEYVCLIQEVQERKKFEFVETVSQSCVIRSMAMVMR